MGPRSSSTSRASILLLFLVCAASATASTCTPRHGQDWTLNASDHCTIDGQSINVDHVTIIGNGTITIRNSSITGTDCILIPDNGGNIVFSLTPPVTWTNSCISDTDPPRFLPLPIALLQRALHALLHSKL